MSMLMNISVSVREQYPSMKGLYGRLKAPPCPKTCLFQLLQESMHVSRLKRYIFQLVSRPLLKPEFFVWANLSQTHFSSLDYIENFEPKQY